MAAATEIGKIIVGVDDSPAAQPALEWAAAEAALHEVPLVILYAATVPVGMWPAGAAPVGFMEWQSQIGEDILAAAAQTVRKVTDGAVPVSTEFAVSTPTAALVEASRTAGMVVAGSRGRGRLARALLGSTSMGLVHRAHCPVVVVRDHPRPAEDAPVLLGFDGSSACEAAVDAAFREASLRRVRLVALHAWWSPGAFEMPGFHWEEIHPEVEREASQQLAGWQERFPDVQVDCEVVADEPARRLVERSEAAQLLVVGSRGHGAVTGTLLGSVSGSVVQEATVPVMVVRPR
ncbi:universal stress protein [Mycolicibacterium duvalii]|uniref:Universal stress protein n=1 Tax=Mycolicibacterium duvalii TaxID=39688 RepID=A0A7I7K4H4_9MYCO|nr:universal stress protein [Mycolicibacterium duvalii]MCV7367940.1 universal stress protein [Mycolicibacterium duvalii]PEG39054.1 universal stress protein [Mycolicibacterium duvalii]BBX18468.1 universal stress protein [Mycolicibacterium duvalii]